MAWVKSVSVAGLAGQSGRLSLTFNRDINVLWGVNGCGKTSLLKIIHSALQDDAGILVRVPFTSAEVEFVQESPGESTHTRTITRRRERQVTVEELVGTAESDTAEYAEMLIEDSRELRWTTKTRSTGARRRTAFPHRYLPISRVTADSRSYRPYYPDRGGPLDEAMLDKVFADDLQNLWRDYSLRASARTAEAQREGIAAILQTVIDEPVKSAGHQFDVTTAAAYGAIKTFFEQQRIPFNIGTSKQFAVSIEKSPILRQVVGKVLTIQEQIKVIEAPRRKFASLVGDVFSGNKELNLDRTRLEIRSQGSRIPLESLSSGERQMLRILVESLSAGSNSIIIDEPELSMHVDWQYHLINSMRDLNPDAQIIAATHSPEVTAELNDAKIFELVAK
jgi:predicted ATP-dependent endonuclease of OLD family